jgi:hypothetical protein
VEGVDAMHASVEANWNLQGAYLLFDVESSSWRMIVEELLIVILSEQNVTIRDEVMISVSGNQAFRETYLGWRSG